MYKINKVIPSKSGNVLVRTKDGQLVEGRVFVYHAGRYVEFLNRQYEKINDVVEWRYYDFSDS